MNKKTKEIISNMIYGMEIINGSIEKLISVLEPKNKKTVKKSVKTTKKTNKK